MITDPLVYELRLADTPYDHEPVRDMVRAFLDKLGINVHEKRVPQDAHVFVTRNDDGSFQFACSIYAAGLPICDSCKSDVLQEAVDVPLAAPVPVIPGAWFTSISDESLRRVLPEDPRAMAEAAQGLYREEHANDVRGAVDRLRRKQDRLSKFLADVTATEATA